MAAIMTLTVGIAGGEPATVNAYTRHQVAWERYARAHKIPAAPGPGFGATEYAAYLAWCALREDDTTVPESFDAFVSVLDSIDTAEPEPVDPTRAAAG